MFRYLLISVLFPLCIHQTIGQQLILQGEDTLAVFPLQDSLEAKLYTNSWLAGRIDNGYIQSGTVTEYNQADSLAITEVYQGRQLSFSSLFFIDALGDTIKWTQSISSKIQELANSGFPFARLELVDVRSEESERIAVTYGIDYGPQIYFDSISIAGDQPLKLSVLYNLLGIYPGQLYSEKRFEALEKKISNIAFLESQSKPDVGFYANKALVFLYLKELNKNRFDAMLGLLPASQNGNNRVNGHVDLRLSNLFRSAIALDINWTAFGQLSQSMKIAARIPTLGRTNLGIDLNGNILRQDSSFVTSSFGTRLFLKPAEQLELRFGYERSASTSLDQVSEEIKGFNYDWYNTSFCFSCAELNNDNRMADGSFSGGLSIGLREIDEGDRLGENSTTLNLDVRFKQKIPYGQRSLFQTETNYRFLENSNDLLENEKYRLGGLNTMRGFFENQFFASQFLNVRNDFRFYLEDQTYILGFIDSGFIDTSSFSFYGSGGIGLSISTNAGILNLIFAQGRIFEDSSNVNNLVHFGYSAVF